jgi:FkbM family methyltransferase
MLERAIRFSAVRLFGFLAILHVDRLPWFRPLFLAFYTAYKQHFEAGPIERLREFIPEGSVVIDVGANVGFFAIRFAQWNGSGEVIAIEPEERNYRALIAALRRQGVLERVRAVQAVAAEKQGTMFLKINRLHPADHKLSLDDSGLKVAAVRLDDLVKHKGLAKPSLIKIDVQGAEMRVLRGASQILEQSGPALFIELSEAGLQAFGSSVAETIDYLAQRGYAPYSLMGAGPHRKSSTEEIIARVTRDSYVDVLFLKTSAPSACSVTTQAG